MRNIITISILLSIVLSGCARKIEYIGRSGPIVNDGGIESGIIINDGKFAMQVKNTSGMAKTINISSFAYRTKVVTQENIELKPVPGYLICRSQQPQVEEFEVLLPGRTYYYNLGIEIKQESIYVCGIKYIIKTGEVYRVYLVIEPFFLLLNKSNLSEISNKLGLINYVDQPIDCGEASLILK